MQKINQTTLILLVLLFGCNQTDHKTTSVNEEKITISTDDKEQIQVLIREVLNWAEGKNSIDLLPVHADSKNNLYIGFDLKKHKQNLEKLKQTNFFATEFIDNYNQIIVTLDKRLRNGNYDPWLVGNLPTFIFANDVSPWTMCQDVPYDKPNPFDFIEVNIISLEKNNAEASWHWGNLEQNADKSWKDFSYKFKVVKENNKWKISYLTGFDFKESTRKDG